MTHGGTQSGLRVSRITERDLMTHDRDFIHYGPGLFESAGLVVVLGFFG